MSVIKNGYVVSVVLLIIAIILWSDVSFVFIGLSIANLGFTLLKKINRYNKK